MSRARRRVERIFRERLGRDVPSDETDLVASGLLDSLAIAELIVALEDEFEVSIDVAELELGDFASLTSIARLVERLGVADAASAEGPADA